MDTITFECDLCNKKFLVREDADHYIYRFYEMKNGRPHIRKIVCLECQDCLDFYAKLGMVLGKGY